MKALGSVTSAAFILKGPSRKLFGVLAAAWSVTSHRWVPLTGLTARLGSGSGSGASLRPGFARSPGLPVGVAEPVQHGPGPGADPAGDVDVVWYRPDQEPKGPSRGEAGTCEPPAVVELPGDRHDAFRISLFSDNVTIKETGLRHLRFGSSPR